MSAPFTFNKLKHHIAEIRQFIYKFDQPLPQLATATKTIGAAKMDLYLGPLSCEEIFQETQLFLENQTCFGKKNYLDWLKCNDDFCEQILSDQSRWVFRKGENPNKYIHIHPGRNSPHILRIKATTLKTAIGIKVYEKRFQKSVTPEIVNEIRVECLGLSSVRDTLTTGSFSVLLDALR